MASALFREPAVGESRGKKGQDPAPAPRRSSFQDALDWRILLDSPSQIWQNSPPGHGTAEGDWHHAERQE